MKFTPHPDDRTWLRRFSKMLGLLDDAQEVDTQLALIQRDGVWTGTGSKCVPCPRRGTHEALTECHLCWCDVAWGYAKAKDVLRARSSR
jgi:hypothetical protein